jgi:hypothetical protein
MDLNDFTIDISSLYPTIWTSRNLARRGTSDKGAVGLAFNRGILLHADKSFFDLVDKESII